jgi:hypothetical protein
MHVKVRDVFHDQRFALIDLTKLLKGIDLMKWI